MPSFAFSRTTRILHSLVFTALLALPAAQTAQSAWSAEVKLSEAVKTLESKHTDVFSKFSAAVVGITSNQKGEDGKPAMATLRGVSTTKMWMGTGAVVSPDGWILTCLTSVPADPMNIKVYFTDGHVRAAEFKAADEHSEGVMIKVDAKDLPFMRVSDSKDYKVGDPVYTWGNPFNSILTDGSVSFSSGSISGRYLASSMDSESKYAGPVIETDAAVNPESDGGPLTDSEGNLIGVLSLAYSRTRWQGLAIPTAAIAEKLPELKAIMKPRRTSLTSLQAPASAMNAAFEAAAEKAGKAVITLRIVRENDKDEAPADFRKLEVKPAPASDEQRALMEARRPQDGFATGFLVSADGVALTAFFNVDERDADGITRQMRQGRIPLPLQREKLNKIKKIYAYLPDGKRYEAKLLGVHKADDLAAIKLDLPAGTKVPYVELDGPAELPTGSSMAILGRSEPPGDLMINAGRVSGQCRFRNTFNQVNALMNYGKIGGPAISLDGKVIGIAAQLTSETDWRQNCGVGFLLMDAEIKKVLPDLIAGKTVEAIKRTFLGVGPDQADEGDGAHIAQVEPDSAASKAGIKPGDIIFEYNGKKVIDFEGLSKITRSLKPGTEVTMKVKRGDKTVELKATLTERAY